MSRYVGPAMVAILAGAGSWFFGLPVVPAIIVLLVVGAVAITLTLIGSRADPGLPTGPPDWPSPPPVPGDGVRRETSELSWALRTPTGIVEDRVLDRVQLVAAKILARRHLGLDNPADRARIEVLMGPQLYAILTSGGGQRVSIRALRAALGTLEALERTDS